MVSVNEPTAYRGYNGIAAAGQLYNLTTEVVVAGTDFFPPPVPPAPNTFLYVSPTFVPSLYAHTFYRMPCLIYAIEIKNGIKI